LQRDEFAVTTIVFEKYEQFSFVDAVIVGYMQERDLKYLYAFDDDFDAVESVSRLDVATNPYQPE